MSRAVKAGMLGLVIVVTVWVLTLWQWRRAPEAVSGQDIVLRLIALPLLLTAAALLAWAAVKRLRALAQRPLTMPPLASGASGLAARAAPSGDAPDLPASVALPEQPVATVLAEALCLSAGHRADEAWHALRESSVRPGLDPELSDAEGLPVFSARVPDLDLHDWLLAHGELGQAGETPLPDVVLRALALIEGPLHSLLQSVSQWCPDVAATQGPQGPDIGGDSSLPADAPSHLSGVARQGGRAERQARAERAPTLQVRLCLPADWTDDDRARAMAWVRAQCGALLDWADAHGAPMPEWHLGWPAGDGATSSCPEAMWSEREPHWRAWSASPRPQLLLLLAADTAVDVSCVAQWQARGELFTSQHQRGRVPGEAGVGLLLANRAWDAWCRQSDGAEPDAVPTAPPSAPTIAPPSAAAADDIAACPHLWRPHTLQRERSADVVGRVDASGVQSLLAGVAERLTPHTDGDWLLVSDGDHRASRTAEVFEGLLAVRPEADPMLSVVRVGDGCGDMGLARALASVALASASLRQGESAALALALLVQDPFLRVAVPLTPPAAQWPVAAAPLPPATRPPVTAASSSPDSGAARAAST